MIFFKNSDKVVSFHSGNPEPIGMFCAEDLDKVPDGIHLFNPSEENQKLIANSMGERVRAPQITYGVDYCDLNCPYCLNEYDNSTKEFALSKYGSKIESLTRLCEWIAQSSDFSLGWAVGEPLSKAGLGFIERFQYALTPETKNRCLNVGLHTNGTWLNKNPFPDYLYDGFRRRSVYWTTSLLSENEESHRSIEKHFDFLMGCAKNFRAKGWFRGLRVVLPTEIPLKDLPEELINQAIEFIKEAQPDGVEPFYLVRLEKKDADVHHHKYNPNCRDFLYRLYKAGGVSHMSPRQHADLIRRSTLSMYDKVIQGEKPNEFLLSDLNTTVKTDQLPGVPYRQFASKTLSELLTGQVNPLCLECSGLPYCTVFQRPDLHYTMGWGREAHSQYEDTLLNMMYLYGLIYLDRLTRGADTSFYRGEHISSDETRIRFPVNLQKQEEAERRNHPEEIISISGDSLYRTGCLVAKKLDGSSLSFPGYDLVDRPLVKESENFIELRLRKILS